MSKTIKWDFKTANTKEYTHVYHSYPAMMIPQIPRELLRIFGKGSKLLFDPYCGTGTSLVEANLQNINAIGTDLNPLARLIAKTKTSIIDIKTLDLYLKDFNDYLFNIRLTNTSLDKYIIKFKNIDYWFKESTQRDLAIIKKYIFNIKEKNIRDFFLVAFSETIRDVSLTKKGEFKLVRIPENRIESFEPDTFSIIIKKLIRNKDGLLSYLNAKKNGAISQVYSFNTADNIPEKLFPRSSFDIVITSPPYGDSSTTVAYGQFSRLANQWLDIHNAFEIDKELMGGKKYTFDFHFKSNALNDTLKSIEKNDRKRALDVKSFFIDYRNSIDNVAKMVRKNGIVCYVVGNRSVKNVLIPTDEITKDFFVESGFDYIDSFRRNIPNKRMPIRNSPTNIKGKRSNTMKNEYIIICRKI